MPSGVWFPSAFASTNGNLASRNGAIPNAHKPIVHCSLRVAFYLPVVIHEKIIQWLLRHERWWLYLALPVVSLIMHWGILGKDLQGMHVWRQTQTQQTIDSFVEEDFNILNPRRLERGSGEGIVRYEFPLYQWLVALIRKVVGGGVLVSRLFSFFLGLLGVWGMHQLLLKVFLKREIALLGAFLMAFSPVWYYYMVCPLPDMLTFCLCIWGMVFLMELVNHFRWRWVVSAGICFGIATLVKLPYAMFYGAPMVWWGILLLRRRPLPWKMLLGSAAIFLISVAPALGWYITGIPQWGEGGVTKGLFHHLADWSQIPDILRFHVLQMIPRTLISVASVPFVLYGLVKGIRWAFKERGAKTKVLVWSGFLAVFLTFYAYEILMIGIDHDYYLFPMVAFLILVAALGAWEMLNAKSKIWHILAIGLLLLVPVMTFRRIHPRWEDANSEFNRDLANHKFELRTAVPDDALVVAGEDISHFIVLYYLHKKGWSWDENQGLEPAKLKDWISQGAEYLYCDDRSVDQNPEIRVLLGPEVGKWGTVWVYSLQK